MIDFFPALRICTIEASSCSVCYSRATSAIGEQFALGAFREILEVPIPLHRFEPYIDDIVLKYIECLGTERNGEPIYTLTSESVHKCNQPSDAYLTLIKNALITEGHLTEKDASRYLKGCMR